MKGILTGLCFWGMSLSVFADAAAVQEAEQFDKETCISTEADRCINAVCPRSEATDCTDQCRKGAVDKCAEKEGSMPQDKNNLNEIGNDS